MPIDNNIGIPTLMGDEPWEGEERREKPKRFLLVGGPWGPMYPLGMMPIEYEEEDADPNP